MGKEPERALVYLRVSVANNVESEGSLDTQAELCMEWAREKGVCVDSDLVYRERGSTTASDRPGISDG